MKIVKDKKNNSIRIKHAEGWEIFDEIIADGYRKITFDFKSKEVIIKGKGIKKIFKDLKKSKMEISDSK